jgi:ubiquinone biosynthesis protein COQ4
MSVLAFRPFEFVALNQMVDAVSLSWPVQAWYRRLIASAPRNQVEQLRELTMRPIDVEALRALPPNTLGRKYLAFLDAHGLSVTGHTTAVPELHETFRQDWVTQRFFKIHDILHTIAGFEGDIAGEMGLQMFNAVNLREPYGMMSVPAAPYMALHYGMPREMIREIIRGYKVGRLAPNLFFVPLEEMWALDIEEARARVGLAGRRTRA